METRTRPARARRRLAIGIAGVAAATFAASTGVASAGDLKIDQLVQEQNQWCWAASGLTIAKFHGKGDVTQNEFCNMARNRTSGSRCPNEPGYLEWDQTAFTKLGLSAGTVSGPLTYEATKAEIDGKRPIETGIYWTAGGGHAQVIYGYNGQTLSYGDPWPSSPRYGQMSHSSYKSNGQFRWGQALSKVGA